MSSEPHQDDSSSRPMPTRLFSSFKRPFSKPKNDHDRYPPDRAHGPIHREAPPNYQQIAMGLHLSRTPHFPAHLAHLYPPAPQPRLHRSVSSPSSSAPPRTRPNSLLFPPPSTTSRSHSPAPTYPPSRLAPPPPRSALKKPTLRAKVKRTPSSSATPDTASASTVASSVLPQTPTRSFAHSGGGLLARFLGKERRTVVVLDGEESVPERKAVRFGGLKEEDES